MKKFNKTTNDKTLHVLMWQGENPNSYSGVLDQPWLLFKKLTGHLIHSQELSTNISDE